MNCMTDLKKHGLTLIPTEGMTRVQWLKKRDEGLGGSDMSSILNLNHRFPAIELYYQKVGLAFGSNEENEPMFWGSRNENTVRNVAQYYDFDSGQYMNNFNNGIKLREITQLGYMVRNDEYPWILGNLDGAENFDPKVFIMDGPAEIKTISQKVVEMWEGGIPPYHIIQIYTYIIACKPMMRTEEASIYYLQDGNKFRGFHMPLSHVVRDEILEKSYTFWNNVLKGREIVANVKDNDTRLRYLAQLEPPPTAEPAYYQHLSRLFLEKQKFVRIEGNEDDIFNAIAYKRLGAEIKSLTEQQDEYKNLIMKTLHDNGANIIDFDKAGKITWNKKLYVNIKEDKLK